MQTLDEVIQDLKKMEGAARFLSGLSSPTQSAEFRGEQRAYEYAVQLLKRLKIQTVP